ncbi:putative 40S ribosomal protein S20 [Paratrimastix pyriformis]|uniref:40S ribosomal protein S20 n=1 Tax=Paratrimastix pyriformis TaxID=342808 RepID=A0ABQ8UUI0_9EUKA|nr:putative 40S ribosomal protein S20 [Paratrimastix pyriformis]
MSKVVAQPGKGVPEQQEQPQHRIRITLSGTNPRALEKVSAELINRAKAKQAEGKSKIQVKGPVRMPTKVLRITTRKTPCGEGSKTWERFEMRIHKRVVTLTTTHEEVKSITAIEIEPGVDVDVTVVRPRAKTA